VSKNAFVMTAIYGDSFCRGAYRSFKLILRNVLRVATVNWVSDFLVFLIKLLVVFSVALIALGVFQNLNGNTVGSSDLTNIQFWIVPVILACIIAYFIASLFCTVLEMIIDTLLICFLEDEERSASGEYQPYMSGDLRRYMGIDASIGGAELQGK
jgi:choline transporter-like protein 2/4/5